MDYKILDKIEGKRETWILVSFFLFFVVCLSWVLDDFGYFLRFWYGTQVKIGKTEITIPKGYYIDEQDKDEYTICDIDDHKIQFTIRTWNGTPEIPKIKERIEAEGSEMHSYNIHDCLVYEFFIRSDTWREDYGTILFLFPHFHLQFMYIGSLTTMYPTMNKFVRSFKRVPDNPSEKHAKGNRE